MPLIYPDLELTTPTEDRIMPYHVSPGEQEAKCQVDVSQRKYKGALASRKELSHESGKRTTHAVHANLNKELEEVCKWFRENKMILNPEKCKALVLARKPNARGLLKVLPYH